MGANPKSRVNPAERAEKQVRAYSLKLLGHSLREIADIMTAEGTAVSHTTVRQLIKDETDLRVLPLAEEVRKQEIDRFDQWLVRLNEQINAGNQVARCIEVGVKVSERRAALLGANAPVQAEVNAVVQHRPTEVLELIEQARERVEREETELKGDVS
jgi:hypothetical protein